MGRRGKSKKLNKGVWMTKCKLTNCPVKSTCGIYIGLEITSDKDGYVIACNRYDFYTKGEKQE